MSTVEEDSTPWRDEKTLREQYWVEEMTIQEMADGFDVSRATIIKWMKRYDIDRRPRGNPQLI